MTAVRDTACSPLRSPNPLPTTRREQHRGESHCSPLPHAPLRSPPRCSPRCDAGQRPHLALSDAVRASLSRCVEIVCVLPPVDDFPMDGDRTTDDSCSPDRSRDQIRVTPESASAAPKRAPVRSRPRSDRTPLRARYDPTQTVSADHIAANCHSPPTSAIINA